MNVPSTADRVAAGLIGGTFALLLIVYAFGAWANDAPIVGHRIVVSACRTGECRVFPGPDLTIAAAFDCEAVAARVRTRAEAIADPLGLLQDGWAFAATCVPVRGQPAA